MVIFQKRRNHSWLYAIKIIRLIASGGGFPILVGFLFILSMFSYAKLLQLLTPSPLVLLALALLIAWIIQTSPYRTWIQSPDLIFLLPMEQKLQNYFWSCLRYNLLMQCIRTGLLFLLLLPIYRLHHENSLIFWLSLLILIAYQALHTSFAWYRIKLHSKWFELALLAFHVLFVFLLLTKHWLWLIVCTAILFTVYFYLQKIIPFYPWPWQTMIKQEQQRIRFYQRIASWFIDLPNQTQTIQPRKWLIALLQIFEKRQTNPLKFLFWRRFIRDRDYLLPYLRGIVFALVMMLIIRHPYLILLIYLLSLTLFAVQFPTLANPNQYPIWLRLYPKRLEKGLTQIALVLIGIQTMLLSIMTWVILDFKWALGLYLLGWLFNLIYSLVYVRYKEQQQKITEAS